MSGQIKYYKAYKAIIIYCFICFFKSGVVAQVTSSEFPGISTIKELDTPAIKKLLANGKVVYNDNADSAVQLFMEALYASEGIGYINGMLEALKRLEVSLAATGRYRESLQIFSHALYLSRRIPSMKIAQPLIYNSIGNIYRTEGNYEEATRYYYMAINASNALGINTSAAYYNNLGSVLLPMDQPDQALYYLNKAEKAAIKYHHSQALGFALLNKGLVYVLYKKWDSALYYMQSALVVARQYHLEQVEHLTLTNIGEQYLLRDMPQKALPYLLETQQMKATIDPYYQNAALGILGITYYKLQDYKLAEKYLLQGIEIARRLSLRESYANLTKTLSEVYAAIGDYNRARYYLAQYQLIKDSVSNPYVARNVNQLEVKYRASEKDKALLQNRIKIERQEDNIRQRNLWIVITAAGALLCILLLLNVYMGNKHRRKLQEEQLSILQQEQEISQLKAEVNGEIQERNRLELELQEGIVLYLQDIKKDVLLLSKKQTESIPSQYLEKVVERLDVSTNMLRITAHNLMPHTLLEEGLTVAALFFCERIKKLSDVEIDFQHYGIMPVLESDVELSLYRILQELVQKAVKNKAAQILVQLSCHDSILSIAVEDDRPAAMQQIGQDMDSIIARVRSLNGTMEVNKDNGMSVYIEMPA